jgi:hypothetical protein
MNNSHFNLPPLCAWNIQHPIFFLSFSFSWLSSLKISDLLESEAVSGSLLVGFVFPGLIGNVVFNLSNKFLK